MGGELIADIIDRAPEMRDSGVRLILQPMTRRGELVKYLFASGFSVLREAYSCDAGKYYVTLLAGYTGESLEIDECEAEFGRSATPCINKEAKRKYLLSRLAAYEKRLAGVERSRCGGTDYSGHVAYIKKLIKELDD